jgi:hypothetical protein
MKMDKRLLLLSACFIGFLCALADEASSLESLLKSFAGEWQGELRVLSVDGIEEQILSVRQRYWWDTIGLRGKVLYGEGDRQFQSNSLTVIIDDRIISEIERGGRVVLLRGIATGNSILWMPLASDADPVLQMRETLEEDNRGNRKIRISGHEIRTSFIQPRRYLYRGVLKAVF